MDDKKIIQKRMEEEARPGEALTVDRKEKVWKVDEATCVSCGACLEKCPKKCLTLG